MKIEHLAIWVRDLEGMKHFYETYFGARAGNRYENPAKRFASYFLSFESGARLEIMTTEDLKENTNNFYLPFRGIAHFALSAGSEENVNKLTARLANDGFERLDGPRRTGDGYYESVVLDPEGNRIEITV
jgi:lactoylglutathione lyase